MTGKELKKLFIKRGFNQSQVAEFVGVKPQSVTSWFNYKAISSKILEQLCDLYHLKMSDIYEDTPYAASTKNLFEQEQDTQIALINQLHEKDRQLEAKDIQIAKLLSLLGEKQDIKMKKDIA